MTPENETITQTRQLPCKLTPEELQARGKAAAEVAAQREHLDNQRKEAAAEYKAQIARKETELDHLFTQLRSGQEHRDVEVEIVKNYRTKSVKTTRTDTGDAIDTRAMTPAELQLTLPKPLPDVKDPAPKDEEE